VRAMLSGLAMALVLAGCGSTSASGDLIAFVGLLDGDAEIFVMNADGTEVRRLTDNDDADMLPIWSPDGDAIAFGSDRDGDEEIFVMNADGTEVRQLTNNGAVMVWRWSPDGESVAFMGGRDGDAEMFVANADGTEVRQLTDNDGPDHAPL